jgi:hypothetical protein
MKKTLALASIVLMVGSLTACGGDDNSSAGGGGGGSYCDQIKGVKADVDGLDFTKLTDDQLTSFREALSGIESAAPADVKDDWGAINDAIDQLQQILNEAGLSLSDLQAIEADPTNLPDGVDLAKLQELAQKLQDFASNSDYQAASDAITANVKSECGIDLSDTSTTGS